MTPVEPRCTTCGEEHIEKLGYDHAEEPLDLRAIRERAERVVFAYQDSINPPTYADITNAGEDVLALIAEMERQRSGRIGNYEWATQFRDALIKVEAERDSLRSQVAAWEVALADIATRQGECCRDIGLYRSLEQPPCPHYIARRALGEGGADA